MVTKVKFIYKLATTIGGLIIAHYKKPDLKNSKAFYEYVVVYGKTGHLNATAKKYYSADGKGRTLPKTTWYNNPTQYPNPK